MGLKTTVAILIAAILVTLFANYKHRQPPKLGEAPLVPYLGLQFAGILVIFLMIAHLITLLTGRPFTGRLSALFVASLT